MWYKESETIDGLSGDASWNPKAFLRRGTELPPSFARLAVVEQLSNALCCRNRRHGSWLLLVPGNASHKSSNTSQPEWDRYVFERWHSNHRWCGLEDLLRNTRI